LNAILGVTFTVTRGFIAEHKARTTVGFEHDVVDGALAARFSHRLVELIESGIAWTTISP